MSTVAPENPVASETARSVELIGAVVLTMVGVILTTYGAFAHVHTAFAPGSAAIFIGAAWLGNVLARRGVRLLSPRSTENQSS